MDPKVLLMPVYSRGNEIERLRGALSLTTFFNAHLDVVYAQSKPSDLLGTELLTLSAQTRQQIITIADEGAHHEQEDLHAHFEELCAAADVVISDLPRGDRPTARWREINGARSALVALQGRVSDLIIIPHSKSGKATLTFQEAVMHTGRPVLLVPRGMWEFKLSNVLVGWDGGLEGARALGHALPFLGRASGITIATGADTAGTLADPAAAAAYLAHHGIAADVRSLSTQAPSTGAAILDMAAELHCDLLVTGAYAHTRLRQWLLGGVTGHLLEHAEVPVLMAH